MSDDLKAKIKEDMIAAMRAQNKDTLGTIRMLQAAIKQKEVDERITLDDTAIVAVIQKMIKQRRESIDQYQQAGRSELADKELKEVEQLEAYLPKQLPDFMLKLIIEKAIETTGATSAKDMGKVMGTLKASLQGQADMSRVSAMLKELLGS